MDRKLYEGTEPKFPGMNPLVWPTDNGLWVQAQWQNPRVDQLLIGFGCRPSSRTLLFDPKLKSRARFFSGIFDLHNSQILKFHGCSWVWGASENFTGNSIQKFSKFSSHEFFQFQRGIACHLREGAKVEKGYAAFPHCLPWDQKKKKEKKERRRITHHTISCFLSSKFTNTHIYLLRNKNNTAPFLSKKNNII